MSLARAFNHLVHNLVRTISLAANSNLHQHVQVRAIATFALTRRNSAAFSTAQVRK